MQAENFTTSIFVDCSAKDAYKAILNVRGWWSGLHQELFEGTAEKEGDEFSFLAGGGVHDTRQKLIKLVPYQKVVWLVTRANLSFVGKTNEWEGTKIMFDILEENDGTRIIFTHEGLVPDFECYDSCAPAWTRYIQERLKSLLMVNKADPTHATH